jgi:hypothetical protein
MKVGGSSAERNGVTLIATLWNGHNLDEYLVWTILSSYYYPYIYVQLPSVRNQDLKCVGRLVNELFWKVFFLPVLRVMGRFPPPNATSVLPAVCWSIFLLSEIWYIFSWPHASLFMPIQVHLHYISNSMEVMALLCCHDFFFSGIHFIHFILRLAHLQLQKSQFCDTVWETLLLDGESIILDLLLPKHATNGYQCCCSILSYNLIYSLVWTMWKLNTA